MCISIINDSLTWLQSQRNSRLTLMIHLHTIQVHHHFICVGNILSKLDLTDCDIYLKLTFKVNPLWPSDTIWWHWSRYTLAQLLACCLMAPSHYQNQRWVFVLGVLWHSSESNFTISWTQPVICIWRLHRKFYLLSQGSMRPWLMDCSQLLMCQEWQLHFKWGSFCVCAYPMTGDITI